MSNLIAVVVQLLHVLLMLLAAPVGVGLSCRASARLAGRSGPPLLQPCRDLWKLARKQGLSAETASAPFEAVPAIVFAASLLAAALVPSFALGMVGAGFADLFVIVGLLLLAHATLALAALDTGTAVGGIAASRTMALAACTQPAALLAIFPLALLLGTSNLDVMAGVLREGLLGVRAPLVLTVAALLAAALGRMRASSLPATVLLREAAGADAALADEYSGRHLALLRWAAALRQLTWLTLLVDLAAPFGLADAAGSPFGWLVGAAAWMAKVGALTLALALWQAPRAARPARVVETLAVALFLSLLAAALLFAGQGPA